MSSSKTTRAALFGLAFVTAMQLDAPAYGYLDPGTGSMLLQLLLGGVAGTLVVCKLYWARIKAFLTRRRPLGSSRRQTQPDQ